METINININNLTNEEREQLLALVKKGNKKVNKRWRAEEGKTFWYLACDYEPLKAVDCRNNFINEENDRMVNNMYSLGNYFQTKEVAIFEREKRLVYQELSDYALEHNTYEMNWCNRQEYKYYIWYDYVSTQVKIGNDNTAKDIGQIYFTSKQIAKDAVGSIGEYRIKKYLFGVE